jgi:hypothetical protein
VEKYILCVCCRSKFSESEVEKAVGCPTCGNLGMPADLRKKHTITLSDHEWRILFIWSEFYEHANKAAKPEIDGVVKGIIHEVKTQCPDMPPLSLFDELQDLATANNTHVTMVNLSTQETTLITPQTKH